MAAIYQILTGAGILITFISFSLQLMFSLIIVEDEEIHVEKITLYLYKYLWDDLREHVNLVGSIIAIFFIQLIALSGSLLFNIVLYLIIIPIKWFIKGFCYLFRNKENQPIINEEFFRDEI